MNIQSHKLENPTFPLGMVAVGLTLTGLILALYRFIPSPLGLIAFPLILLDGWLVLMGAVWIMAVAIRKLTGRRPQQQVTVKIKLNQFFALLTTLVLGVYLIICYADTYFSGVQKLFNSVMFVVIVALLYLVVRA